MRDVATEKIKFPHPSVCSLAVGAVPPPPVWEYLQLLEMGGSLERQGVDSQLVVVPEKAATESIQIIQTSLHPARWKQKLAFPSSLQRRSKGVAASSAGPLPAAAARLSPRTVTKRGARFEAVHHGIKSKLLCHEEKRYKSL